MAKLDDERGKEGARILLSFVLKVEKEVSNMNQSCLCGAFDVLDDG